MQNEKINIELSLADNLRGIQLQIDELLKVHGLLPSSVVNLMPNIAASAFAMDDVQETDSFDQPDIAEHLYPIHTQTVKPPARASGPSLPHPKLIRQIIRNRQLRRRFFGSELFADPAWDMLLDLSATEAENRRVCVSSLCIASNVPQSTALRWIELLAAAGFVERKRDSTDARRIFVTLTTAGTAALAKYFSALGSAAEFAL